MSRAKRKKLSDLTKSRLNKHENSVKMREKWQSELIKVIYLMDDDIY